MFDVVSYEFICQGYVVVVMKIGHKTTWNIDMVSSSPWFTVSQAVNICDTFNYEIQSDFYIMWYQNKSIP